MIAQSKVRCLYRPKLFELVQNYSTVPDYVKLDTNGIHINLERTTKRNV